MTWMVFLRVKVPKDTSFGRLRQIGGRDIESSEGEKVVMKEGRKERRAKRAKSHGAKRKRASLCEQNRN